MGALHMVLWGITQSGTAGHDCGIGDSRIAKIVGYDRNTVWEYRRHARSTGLLRYSESGMHFGRVRSMDFVPADAGLFQTPTAAHAGLFQRTPAVMLSGPALTTLLMNNTLMNNIRSQCRLQATMRMIFVTCNSVLRATANLSLRPRTSHGRSEWEDLGFDSADEHAAWLLAKSEPTQPEPVAATPERYKPAAWDD